MDEDSLVFRPNAGTARRFPTPIQQIVSFSSSPEQNTLTVRTFGSTHLLRMENIPSSEDSIGLTELATIIRDDVERPVSDVVFSPQSSEHLVCNDQGDIYTCRLHEGQKLLKRAFKNEADTVSGFWRLGPPRDMGCLLMSERAATELDFRTPSAAMELFSVLRSEECLTSIEGHFDEHIVHLSSTSQLLWMDRRFPGKPLLGFRHQRQWDRSLTMRTVTTIDGNTRTLLSSGKNNVITVYDVGHSLDSLVHAYNLPYTLSPGGERMRFFGQTVLQLPGYPTSLFRLSQRGSIYRTDLDIELASGSHTLEWSSEIHDLDKLSDVLEPDLGPLGSMEYSEVNMNPLYVSLFTSYTKEDVVEEAIAEETYDLMDAVPSFWQRSDTGTDEMMTTYDVAFRSGEEPASGSRSDFLTGSAFNSTRGYRAMVKGRFPMNNLRAQAMWHHDISPTLEYFDTTVSGDAQTIFDCLQRFDLSINRDHPSEVSIRRQETKAREQLALDLALSKDVFSSRKFSVSFAAAKELEIMTKALTIGNEGPGANFHYLEPQKKATSHYDKEGQEEQPSIPLGARLLLKDWEVGADPEKGAYRFRYSMEESGEKSKETEESKIKPLVSVKYEPLIRVAEKQLLPASQANAYESQSTEFDSQSQSIMVSTQILPGPFGVRPNAIVAKKKAGKKRMGGF